MKLTKNEWLRSAGRQMRQNPVVIVLMAIVLLGMALAQAASAQAVSTTTVQGTVYLANGQAGSGTLHVSWPAFTTANGLAVAADSTTVQIAPDGFVSVSLTPNLGATPAGLYYTAVFYMSDGTTSTQYWVVPSAAQASLAQVQSQLMPAAQAVQAVSKAYVDQSISELTQSVLTASGGTLSGPLYLSADPTQALQASDKHYVDTAVSQAVPLSGGNMTGALSTPAVNGVQAPTANSAQTTLQATMTAASANGAMEIPPTYAGTDGFTNPNGVRVTDLRTSGAQQSERSVKEFGAVCDGATDDTNALQTALNYAQTHGVALTIPQGTCKTRTLNWHGESIGGMGKQVSALLGYPGQDVLASLTDSPNLLQYTRLHDLTIYVDQSVDVSCSPAEGRAAAGSCGISRPMEGNSIFSPGGNGLTGVTGTGAGWAVGNCAIAMPALLGTGGNGLRVAEMENLEIATTGVDPLAGQYPGAHSTHTCGMYLAQWPQWSEFRNIDIRGLNTGIAMPALPGTAPAGLNADSNRWQNITIQATHGFTAAAGSNNVLDNVVALAGNSSAASEPPTGLVLDLGGTQQGWTVRNAVVIPSWNAVQPQLTVTAAGGAVTGITIGTEHGLGFDPYGTQVPLKFSGSCTAAATANVNSDGSIGTISVTQGGAGCSGTTTASVNVAGSWDTAAAVNLIGGQSMTFFAGNLLKGNGGYTVWNAPGSESYGTQLNGGGGTAPGGAGYAALVGNNRIGTTYEVDQFPGADFGAKLQSCLNTVSTQYGGDCDARNFTGSLSMGSNLAISTANTTVQLPCATISTANQIVVTAGTRNVALRGCALRGGSAASGSQGGTVFAYSGTGAIVQVGDPTYAADTQGFHMDDVVINTTAATNATAQGMVAYRTQEMDLESLYFLGNANQTGMTLDGTGNYTGGTYFDNAFNGFQTAVNAIGHQVANAATTDWMNASAFVRLHIDCPTSGGSPIAGTYGINLQQGDGNTFTGGDVEGCSTALHLGANAQNNTIVGLRNENSTSQVVADAGSSYNNWMTGGTMFTGKLTDNGTRNSFLDTFHRSFNGMNGDWYGSQQDATVTNHYRIGTGAGNERGLLNRYQTDYGYRWTTGLSDATAGEQFYQVLDELNNVYRLSIGQYNNGQPSTNNQTVINAAGTGAVVLNGSNNSGTGGVVVGSGGANASTVATINNGGNAQFNGTLQIGGTSTFSGTTSVKNQADAEIDQVLWAGATASQKESVTYKDWNGNSQWYAMKDASNNWALNSATGGLDSFKAYQSTNSGDTYVNASNASGVVRVNYETGAGTAFKIYGGGSNLLYASFTATNSIQFPGLAAGSGQNCLQIDNSGYLSNTGSACGSGSGGSGTVNAANSGQIAYYTSNGSTISGISAVPVTAGGTGSATAAGALQNLGGVSTTATSPQTISGPINAPYTNGVVNAALQAGADGGTKLTAAITAACAAGVRVVDARGFGVGNQTVSSTVGLGCSDGTPLEIVFDQSTKWIPSTSTTDLFWLEPGANAKNVTVDVTTVSGFSGNGMKLCCTSYGNQPANSSGGARTELNGYTFNNGSNPTGTALSLVSTSGTQWIQFADFSNVNISGGLNAVLLSASNSGWVNGNTFHNVKQTNAVHGFEAITASGGSVVGNRIDSYQAEIGSNVLDYIWITGTGSCYGNKFSDFQEWDMNAPTTSQHTVLIDANCTGNLIDGTLGAYVGSAYPWIVTDNNGNNYLFGDDSGFTYGSRTFNNAVNATMFNATTYTTGFQFNGHTFLTSDGGSTFLQPMTSGDVCFGSEYGGTFWCRDGSGNLKNNNGTILPAGLTGYYGSSGTKVQLSDGTGMSGNLTKFASDGSVTNGPPPPAGAIVGTTDTQTLTNKSIAGSEINSGVLSPTYGGTGQNESSATGVGQFGAGTYSVSTALANGTSATTQSAGDNSTKIATTAYVASPGAIAPTTVTASGIITAGNDTTLTTSTTISTTGFTTTGLVLPAVPVSSTKSGRCVIYWQMSSTSYTATFGIGMSNTPTGLWGGSSVTYAVTGTSSWLAFSQTATAATPISTAATAGATGTTYRSEIDVTLQTGATNPVSITVYGEVSNTGATLTIEPGSTCYWLP